MCLSDLDCPGNLICHSGDVFWAPPTIVNGSFCDCSILWGYVESTSNSQTCSELGPHAIYSMAYTVLSMVVCTLAVFSGISTLVGLRRSQELAWNDTILTVVLTKLGFLLFLIWKVVLLVEVVEADEHNVQRGLSKQHELFQLELGLISASYFVILAALSNIGIVWMDVAVRTERFNISGTTSFKPRRYVRTFQGFVSIGLLVALLIGGNMGFFLAGILSLLGLGGVVVIYAVGRRWFRKLLHNLTKSNAKAELILHRINLLTNVVLVCSVICSIGFTAFGVFNFFGIEYFCPKGTPCIQIIARDVGTTAALVALLASLHYCRLCLGFETLWACVPTAHESSNQATSLNDQNGSGSPKLTRPNTKEDMKQHITSPVEEMI